MKRFKRLSYGWTFKRAALSFALIFVLLAIPTAAFADQITNTIDSSVDPALETVTITAGGSTTVSFYIIPSNTVPAGDASGCNATGANPAKVTLSVPTGVMANQTLLTFSGCGISTAQSVQFSSSLEGDYSITVASVSGGKTGSQWDTAPAAFTLDVDPAPPTNTAPTLSLPSDITAEATGPNGAVVNYSASASDAEDDPDLAHGHLS